MGFRTYLEQSKTKTGRPLGKSTMRSVLATLREFILWLSQQDGVPQSYQGGRCGLLQFVPA